MRACPQWSPRDLNKGEIKIKMEKKEVQYWIKLSLSCPMIASKCNRLMMMYEASTGRSCHSSLAHLDLDRKSAAHTQTSTHMCRIYDSCPMNLRGLSRLLPGENSAGGQKKNVKSTQKLARGGIMLQRAEGGERVRAELQVGRSWWGMEKS